MNGNISGFNGLRIDHVSGNYHPGKGYRSYSPILMRFTAPDSWSPFGAGGINTYSYCAGDPINRSDPSGHFSWQAALGIGMGILGIIGTLFTGGAALIAAGGLEAAMLSASATTMLVGGSGIVADISGILSITSAGTHPRAASALGWLSFASGLLSLGAGLLAGIGRSAMRADGERVSTAQHYSLAWTEPGENLLEADTASASQRLSSEQARAWIDDKNNFAHKIRGNNITSRDLNNKLNLFSNKFKPNKWTFINNYRRVQNVPYYASDIARYQYEKIAAENNFIGKMPDVLVRSGVSNETTLALTEGKSGEELFDAFFKTPNGKSTQRVMSDFGLTANAVERREIPDDDAGHEAGSTFDFIIRLNPLS